MEKKNLKIMATCAASAAALALVAPASAAVYTYNVNVTQIQGPSETMVIDTDAGTAVIRSTDPKNESRIFLTS